MTDLNRTDIKKMSVKEFRELGYLQEVNRRFLHPLGLALEVRISKDGKENITEVWDYRDDPEGLIFGPGIIDIEKARRIYTEQVGKQHRRIQALGYDIQPD
jgi:hypothetical protein